MNVIVIIGILIITLAIYVIKQRQKLIVCFAHLMTMPLMKKHHNAFNAAMLERIHV